MLCGSRVEKAHVWRIMIMGFLFFVLFSFFAGDRDGVFMRGLPIRVSLVDGLKVLVLMPDRLRCWIDDWGLFSIVRKTDLTLSGFCPVPSWARSRLVLR